MNRIRKLWTRGFVALFSLVAVLTSLTVADASARVLASYTYTLNASGQRTQVVEKTGRTTSDAYDGLDRLASETLADPGDSAQNGAISYTLDKVGNRLSRASSVAPIPSTANTYNVRDWLDTDTYDANGNTTIGHLPSAIGDHTAGTDVYDFENRLIVRTQPDGTQICVSYDTDGNRFQKTILDSGLNPVRATYYLVDTNNPTGYSQVLEEQTMTGGSTPSSTLKVYTYGADLISRTDFDAHSSLLATHYFSYDGHGSVRKLTDENGTVTDSYDYDAFGVLLHHTGSSDNAYLYSGEQWDADLGLYFNRARYLNPGSSRISVG